MIDYRVIFRPEMSWYDEDYGKDELILLSDLDGCSFL